MTSHDIAVLSGEVGSANRTKKINKMLNVLDRLVAKGRDKNRDRVKVSSGYIADELNYSSSTINRNGYPQFFDRHYESINHKANKGLIIHTEKYTEERKEQREKLSNEEEEV